AAGAPILALENIENHCRIDPDFFSPRADYLLRVRGMSMKDIGILDGDLLAVHRTSEARNGQVVVARIDDEVTVKRFHKQGRKVSLIAENPEFAPIEIDLGEQELIIEGLSVGVIRHRRSRPCGMHETKVQQYNRICCIPPCWPPSRVCSH